MSDTATPEKKTELSIPLSPVVSSNIAAVGYDLATQTLAVQFKHGAKVYHYANVPPDVHEEMGKAESIGKFIGAHVVKKFDFTTVTLEKDEAK